jgi:hypothetical protein
MSANSIPITTPAASSEESVTVGTESSGEMSASSIPDATLAVDSEEFIIIGMETASFPTMQAENGT